MKILNIFSGTALKILEKFNDGIIIYDRVIEINPNFVESYINKGERF